MNNQARRDALKRVAAFAVAVGASALTAAAQDDGLTPSDRLFIELQPLSDKGDYAGVVRVGEKIREIDKYGDKYDYTAAVYAIMANSHAQLGRKAEKEGDLKAALRHFKRAASCNRSFADALQLFRGMRGTSKAHADEVQEVYNVTPERL